MREPRYDHSELEGYLMDPNYMKPRSGNLTTDGSHLSQGSSREALDRVDQLVLDPDAEPPADKFDAMLANMPMFELTWERKREDLADNSASAYDMSLASQVAQAGWSAQEIANLIIASRRHHGDDLKMRQDYYRRTIAKARASVEQTEPSAPSPGNNGASPLTSERLCPEELLSKAKTDPSGAVREVLGSSDTVHALAVLANQDPRQWEKLRLELRDAGVKAGEVESLTRAVNAERRNLRGIREARAGETPELVSVKDAVPGAPVPDGAKVPEGWVLSSSATEAVTSQWDPGLQTHVPEVETIAPSPIVISNRLVNVQGRTESLTVAWFRDGQWKRAIVDRSEVADSRKIVALSDQGLPVTSENARQLVRYLASFESENLHLLPRLHVSDQMGWQGEKGRLGFLCGRKLIRGDGQYLAALRSDGGPPEDWQEDWVTFKGADAGDEQIVNAYRSEGTLDAWLDAVSKLSGYPRAILGLYAALAPPLLMVLDAPNFVIDWCGATSTGKTTILRVAASCWGVPDERAPSAAIGSWDMTRVGVERTAEILNGLPVILDDTKRAKQPKIVAQMLYDVTSGRGRGRGSPRGLRESGSWATVLLSSGEAPAVSFTEDGGTRGRVLTLWGSPLGRADSGTAPLVHELNMTIRQNHGHAGPLFVEYILKRRDQWPKWRTEFRRAESEYLARAKDSPVAARLSTYFAVLDIAAGIAHAALELPWPYSDPVDPLWEDLIAEAGEAEIARRALQAVVSWAHSNASSFLGRHRDDRDNQPITPPLGWAGAWEADSSWSFIGFYQHRLKDILTNIGFEPEPVLRIWRERGWLETDSRQGFTKRVRIGRFGLALGDKDRPRLVVITRDAIDEAMAQDG